MRLREKLANLFFSADRDDRSFGRDRNRDSDKTDTDWRARPAADSFDDYPSRRGDDSFGDSKFSLQSHSFRVLGSIANRT